MRSILVILTLAAIREGNFKKNNDHNWHKRPPRRGLCFAKNRRFYNNRQLSLFFNPKHTGFAVDKEYPTSREKLRTRSSRAGTFVIYFLTRTTFDLNNQSPLRKTKPCRLKLAMTRMMTTYRLTSCLPLSQNQRNPRNHNVLRFWQHFFMKNAHLRLKQQKLQVTQRRYTNATYHLESLASHPHSPRSPQHRSGTQIWSQIVAPTREDAHPTSGYTMTGSHGWKDTFLCLFRHYWYEFDSPSSQL